MARADCDIELGPGGEIRDVPENKELLEEIRETRELSPADLLKLGAYFKDYSTNAPLGDHLTLVALFRLVNEPGAKRELESVLVHTAAAVGKTVGSPQDAWDLEDYFDFGCDDPDEGGRCLPFIRFIPFSNTNLGLLIETPARRHHKQRNFVIGISPAPASVKPAKGTMSA